MTEFATTWELVSTDTSFSTYRMRTIGGWLVVVRDASPTPDTTAMTFVADPKHEWEI